MSTRAQVRSGPPGSTAPAPPPRRRARPPGTTRAGRPPKVGARRRRLLVIGIVVAVLLAAAYGASVSPLLAVDSVQVRGAGHLTPAQVSAAAGVHPGDAMAWIDMSGAVDGVEALPYVRDATIRREWPRTVRITVHERTPRAWLDGPAGKVLVDGTGRVLETVTAAPAGLPQLLGATVVPPPGGTIGAVGALGAARVAGALRGLAAVGTASVETTDHGIVLHLLAGPEIRMGDATQVDVKVRAALAVLEASQGVPVGYVDVSVPTNPVTG